MQRRNAAFLMTECKPKGIEFHLLGTHHVGSQKRIHSLSGERVNQTRGLSNVSVVIIVWQYLLEVVHR